MQVATTELLESARAGGYAVGAFNVYNLEGVRAVVAAAEAARSPVMLQVHSAALKHGGPPLIALCLAAARGAAVPIAVQLDHSTDAGEIDTAIRCGVTSIMADGSHLDYGANLCFTREMAALAHANGVAAEAELGRLAGTEDGWSVAAYEASLTNVDQAAAFVDDTGVDMLAVCIGNVHGAYDGEPRLDFARLAMLQERVAVPLVLHGASGLPDAMVRRAITLGVRKFNVNTELREAYLKALGQALNPPASPELLPVMRAATVAMQEVVVAKLRLFGSFGRVLDQQAASV